MKISKRQLRKIIKEEKARVLREANPDGTISPDEEEAEEELMMQLELQIDDMISLIHQEAEVIGGGFRSPGIRDRALKLLADKIHRAR